MKRRRWDSKTKTKIVLEGLSGRPVSEICNEYGIHQNQYYSWRDKFLSEARARKNLNFEYGAGECIILI
ncbi:transposase [Desulfobacterota bacterium AH_259_B03_O07]|nr:transposase [Desulfobacterota bacterium AH_259_B03_O07]